MAEKQIERMNEVIEESKASAVRAVMHARVEMAMEDPSSWDVHTWQSVLDTLNKDEELKEEELKDEGIGASVEKDDEVTSRGKA